MTTDLPGVNYNAPFGNDDLAFSDSVYRDQFLERMKLVFGHPDWITDSSWGIVAETDPTAVTTSSTEPGVVTASGLNVSVRAVMAVTRSGHLIILTSAVSEKAMANAETNAINVVTLKYSTADPEETSPNEYHAAVYRRREVPDDTDLVVVYSLTQWNALTSEQQYDHIPLAISTVLESGGTKTLEITHSNTNYTWLRPWFSPVDVRHRLQVGTGTVSDTNPHGNSPNDFSVGNFTVPMLMQHVGMVISQEKSFSHVPGSTCTSLFDWAAIQKDDASGTVTGVANAYYIDLGFYPVTLGEVYDTSTDFQYCFRTLPGTTIIFQPEYAWTLIEGGGTPDLTVKATRVTALEPPVGSVVSSFDAGSLGTYDSVLASGQIYVKESTVDLTDTMADAGPIPLVYRFYFADGAVVKNPQVIMCYTNVDDIDSGITPSITQFGNGFPIVCLDGATASASLNVQVRITGTDADGASVSEVATFNFANWHPSSVSCVTPYDQFQEVVNSVTGLPQEFASITSVSLDAHVGHGANASIMVWIRMSTVTTEELSYACLIAEGQWGGSEFCTMYDKRQIHYDAQLEQNDPTGMSPIVYGQLYDPSTKAEPGNRRGETYFESFERPIYGNLINFDRDDMRIDFEDTDRTVKRLYGYYESRAFNIPSGRPTITNFEKCVVLVFPAVASEHHRAPTTQTVEYKLFNEGGLGVWSPNWLTATRKPGGSSTVAWWEIETASVTVRAVKLKIFSTYAQGFVLVEYHS